MKNAPFPFAGAESTLQEEGLTAVMLRFCNTFHRSAGVLGVSLLLLACELTLCAEPADEPDLTDQIAGYVESLSSDALAERTAAERALLEIGPPLLDLLPPPDLIDDPAARDALGRIRQQIEIEAAEESIGATHVTLAGEYSLAEIAAEISRQTGNTVVVDRLPQDVPAQVVDVQFDETPFWQCIAELTATTDLSWSIDGDAHALVLIDPGPDDSAPVAAATRGAFRVELESVAPKRSTLRAQMRIVAEPRLRPLFLSVTDADFSASAGHRELSLFNPNAHTELPMTSREPVEFAVIFSAGNEQSGGATMSIDGRVTIHTAALPREVRFRDLTAETRVARRRGGVTVTLTRSRFGTTNAGDRTGRFRLTVAYDTGGPAFESHRTWIYHNEVYLEALDGTRIAVNDGFDTTAQADGGVGLEYRFKELPDVPPQEWELVYIASTLLIDVPVEFQFESEAPSAEKTE
ncbi:MAG: hypothetical protein DWQ34_13480 [Planctomycetota bacterium]|nr:MAG: hypothetical protein DWQ34_13480 [Planctomycetota bacterium]